MARKGSEWTDERVELLKKLWADGLSAGRIATQMSGFTRNAIIGKVGRLQLSGRARPVSSAPRSRTRKADRNRLKNERLKVGTLIVVAGNTVRQTQAEPAPRRLPMLVPIEDVLVPMSLNIALMALNDAMCKWPTGDVGEEDFHFCGHKNWNSLSYCEYHSRLAYQPSERRRDRRTTYVD